MLTVAYQFGNQQKASATIYNPVIGAEATKLKLAGINGLQTNANNFHTAITGLMTVVGLTSDKMERAITQEVEEAP